MSEPGAPRALPPPLIDPADLIALVPGLDPARAEQCAQLATLAILAYVWPGTIPDPTPPPVYAVCLGLAARIAGSVPGGPGSALVSESLGGYSYRYASPIGADEAMLLTDVWRRMLEPWRTAKGVTELTTWPGAGAWPFDWWQRDYDNLVAAWDEGLVP